MTEVIRPSSESSSQHPHQYSIHQIANIPDFIKTQIGNIMQQGKTRNYFRRAGESISFCISKESGESGEELFWFFKSLIVALASKGEYLDGLSKVILKSGKSLYHHMASGSIKMGDFQSNQAFIDLGQRKKLPDHIPQKNVLNQSGVNKIMMQFHKEDHKDITADMLFFSLFYEKGELHIIHGFHIENLFKIQAFLQGQQIPSTQDFKVSKYTAQVCVAQDVESENFNPFQIHLNAGIKELTRYIVDPDKNNKYYPCRAGEKIAQIEIKGFPKNGRDIYGKILPIPEEYHKNFTDILGDNIFFVQEEGKIFVVSSVDGVICYTGGNKPKISVKENYELSIGEKSEKNLEFHGKEITLNSGILQKNIKIVADTFVCEKGEISGSIVMIQAKISRLEAIISNSQLTFQGESIQVNQIGQKVVLFAPKSEVYIGKINNDSCVVGKNVFVEESNSPYSIFAFDTLKMTSILTKAQDMFVFGQNIQIDKKNADGEGHLYMVRLDRQDEEYISQIQIQQKIFQDELEKIQRKFDKTKAHFDISPNGNRYIKIKEYLLMLDQGIKVSEILKKTNTQNISDAKKILYVQLSKIFYESGNTLRNLGELDQNLQDIQQQLTQLQALLSPVSWSVGLNINGITGAVPGKTYYTTFSMQKLVVEQEIQGARGNIANYTKRILLDKKDHRMCEKSFYEKSDEST